MQYRYTPAPAKKRRPRGRVLLAALLVAALVLAVVWFFVGRKDKHLQRLEGADVPSWVTVDIIDVDGASRRGEALEGVRDIVVHYIGNPGTTARQNRDFFNNPASTVSAHFVIGLEGEVIQCVPLTEKSSASNHRNTDTISIEVCHPDESGRFTERSYRSLVELTAWLCGETGLGSDDIIRHYDVTGKLCPLYFVENEDDWRQFKADVEGALA